NFDLMAVVASPTTEGSGVRVASLETDIDEPGVRNRDGLTGAVARRATFEQRFYFGRMESFEARFAGTPVAPAPVPSRGLRLAYATDTLTPADAALLPPVLAPNPAASASVPAPRARPVAAQQPTFRLASLEPTALPGAPEKRSRVVEGPKDSQDPKDAATPGDADANSRTAIYDISAQTVYLPGGRRLEAHSGLGDLMDDPRHIQVRMRGPTPVGVYKLSLRESLFHGVRAIRLNPTDETKM